MALYRCAACGSPNVVTDQENNGIQYDYVKGAIGTVVLGAGGAVAGITNKTQTVFKCRDCGVSLSYPLGEPYKSLIDTGVASAAGRKTLNINGFPMSWENIKKKYPNIESGYADLEIQEEGKQRTHNKKLTVEYLLSLWEVDHAHDMVFLQKTPSEIEEDQKQWEKDRKQLSKQKQAHLQSAFLEEERSIQMLQAKQAEKLATINEQKELAAQEVKSLENHLATLGFLKFSEKSQTKQKIAQLTEKIDSLRAEFFTQKKRFDEEYKRAQENLTYSKKNLEKKLDVIYATEESPKDRLARLQKENTGDNSVYWSLKFYLKRYLPRAMKFYGKASDEELADVMGTFIQKFGKLSFQPATKMDISMTRRYYSPFITESNKGQIVGRGGLITDLGTFYYEFNDL